MLPTLLMLPSILCDERIFQRQRIALHDKVRFVCASYSHMKYRSRWLAQQLSRLPERFHVAGFSLVGLMALETPSALTDTLTTWILMPNRQQALVE